MLGEELRVADVLRHQARERGGRVAIKHGSRSLTYAELDERSNRLAQALLAAGVGPGARVAYLDRTAPEVVELLFAAEQDRRGARAAELAAARRRARRDPRRTPARRC